MLPSDLPPGVSIFDEHINPVYAGDDDLLDEDDLTQHDVDDEDSEEEEYEDDDFEDTDEMDNEPDNADDPDYGVDPRA